MTNEIESTSEIERIRERLKFCSGPWFEKTDAIVSEVGLVCVMNTDSFDHPEDQHLIAHAPADIDYLLTALAQAQAERDSEREHIDDFKRGLLAKLESERYGERGKVDIAEVLVLASQCFGILQDSGQDGGK